MPKRATHIGIYWDRPLKAEGLLREFGRRYDQVGLDGGLGDAGAPRGATNSLRRPGCDKRRPVPVVDREKWDVWDVQLYECM